MVKAIVGSGKKAGTWIGRVAIRATGNFNIQTKEHGVVQGINAKHCRLVAGADGYAYSLVASLAAPAVKGGVSRGAI